jgi:GTP-binding protein
VEKFSVIKTLQAIDDANVVVLLFDAEQGISEQDAHLAGFILEAGRALVVAVNKWDAVPVDRPDEVKREPRPQGGLSRVCQPSLHLGAEGRGIPALLRSVDAAYASAMAKLPTPKRRARSRRPCCDSSRRAPEWGVPSFATPTRVGRIHR